MEQSLTAAIAWSVLRGKGPQGRQAADLPVQQPTTLSWYNRKAPRPWPRGAAGARRPRDEVIE